MTDWGRLDFLPGWAEARIRRRQEREARIEWASRDGIFFAAIVANAHEMWFLVLLATVASASTFTAGIAHSTDFGRFQIPLFVFAFVSSLVSLASLWWACRCRREWREAATRRGARAKPIERML
jgi:hypothetical protein